MKNWLKIAAGALLLLLFLSACGAGTDARWLSPTVSLEFAGANRGQVFTGAPLYDVPNNSWGPEIRGRILSEPAQEGATPINAQLTAAQLEAAGALRLTARLTYGGDQTHNIRFRFRVDRFQGHSITQYALPAMSGVLILWQDAEGAWWNIRRTGLGHQFTGGDDASGTWTLPINKTTAANFYELEFFALFLEYVPFRTNAEGEPTDYMSGYVLTFQAELPDADGHFHNFNVLASTSVYIHVSPPGRGR